MLKGGLSWDEGPTNNIDRSVNTSTVDSIGFNLGLRYQVNNSLGIDLNYGYSRYIYAARINSIRTLSYGVVSANVHDFEARLTWKV